MDTKDVTGCSGRPDGYPDPLASNCSQASTSLTLMAIILAAQLNRFGPVLQTNPVGAQSDGSRVPLARPAARVVDPSFCQNQTWPYIDSRCLTRADDPVTQAPRKYTEQSSDQSPSSPEAPQKSDGVRTQVALSPIREEVEPSSTPDVSAEVHPSQHVIPPTAETLSEINRGGGMSEDDAARPLKAAERHHTRGGYPHHRRMFFGFRF
jgi:hypothetical protein